MQHVVEAPRAAGAVPLRVPDGCGPASGGVAAVRAPNLGLDVVETPDVAEIAREDAIVIVGLVAIGERHAGDRVAAEVVAEAGDVEPGVTGIGLVYRAEIGYAQLPEFPRELAAGLGIHDAPGVDQRVG